MTIERMRHLKYVFVFLLFLLCASDAAAQWDRIQSEQCNLSALYPGMVNEQTRTNQLTDSLTTREYRFLASFEEQYFLMYCSVWPEGFIKGSTEAKLEGSLAGIDGEVLHEEKIALGEYLGRSFIVDLSSGKGLTFVRAYIAGNVVIQMQAILLDPSSEELSPEGERFLESIQIGEP